MLPVVLTEQTLDAAVVELTAIDPDLAAVHARLGTPPLWARPTGFPTLVHIILEQQVSLASARAAFDRLRAAVSPLTPAGFMQLDDDTLLAIGFSRQKRVYCRHLAEALIAGKLDLDELATLDDDQVRRSLIALKGIGPWSAEIYLLMALGRADAWPAGDLALAVAAQEVKRLDGRPDPVTLTQLAEAWRPWRAAAARLLWHHYLSKPQGKETRRSHAKAQREKKVVILLHHAGSREMLHLRFSMTSTCLFCPWRLCAFA